MELKTYNIQFSSNAVRLSPRQFLLAAICFVTLLAAIPPLWEHFEKFEPGKNWRIPYKLADDYRLFERWCKQAAGAEKTLVIGDSVVWGHYVKADQTLSAWLNKLTASDRFVNLGVDGTHPAALAGLLKYYGSSIRNKTVILHFNPLWISSFKHDLQEQKEFAFNHPKLVPQFLPIIRCYKKDFSQRIGIVLERSVPFLAWVSHLKSACFDGADLYAWTLENPYGNPAAKITFELPADTGDIGSDQRPWDQRGISKQDFPWVRPADSFQWLFFKETIRLLAERGNKIIVLVGPFNEHLLRQADLAEYETIKRQIESDLNVFDVASVFPDNLPAQFYADASHPIAEGYEIIARRLLETGLLP